MEHQEKLDELFRRINAGEAAVQPVAPSIAEGVGRLSAVRINLRGWVETALQRLQSSDLAISVHAASTGGGGRITSIAALIGICVSGVGAGTYCVATALLPDPKPAIRSESKAAKRKANARQRSSHGGRTRAESTCVAVDRPSAQLRHPLADLGAARADSSGGAKTSAATNSRSKPARRPVAQPHAELAARGTVDDAPPGPNGSFETGRRATELQGQSEFSDGGGGEFSP